MKKLFEGFGVTAIWDRDGDDTVWFNCDHDFVYLDSVDVLFNRDGFGLTHDDGFKIVGQLYQAKYNGERAIVDFAV